MNSPAVFLLTAIQSMKSWIFTSVPQNTGTLPDGVSFNEYGGLVSCSTKTIIARQAKKQIACIGVQHLVSYDYRHLYDGEVKTMTDQGSQRQTTEGMAWLA